MDDRDLTRLLDEAAAAYEPVPSPGRLAVALARRPTSGRRLYLVLGVAAGLTVLGAGAAALTGAESAIRTPADQFEVDVTIERGVPMPTTTTTVVTDDGDPRTPRLVVAPLVVDRDVVDQHVERTATPSDLVVTGELDPQQLELADAEFVSRRDPAPPTTTLVTTPTTTHAPAPPTTSAPAPTTTHAPAPPPTTHAPAPTTTHAPAPTTTHAPHPPTTTEPPHQDPPPTTTTTVIEFTAHQFWGSCGSDPPYEEFQGHAAPGSTISVTSPHGGASTAADAHGNWYVKVFVPDAPIGETFSFTASSSAGGSATFSFVRTA